MPLSQPFGIKGTVTVGGTAFRGAKVWAINLSSRKNVNTIADVTYFYTDSNGRYVISAANFSITVSTGNKIRVFCQAGSDKNYADVTVLSTAGGATQNFTFSNKSGLTDSIKDTRNADGTGAILHNPLYQSKSTKDAMN